MSPKERMGLAIQALEEKLNEIDQRIETSEEQIKSLPTKKE